MEDTSEEYYYYEDHQVSKSRWFIWGYWILFSFIIIGGLSIFYMASTGVFGKMPTFDILENPSTNLATEILSEEGKTLGKIYISDNRTLVDYENISPFLVQALVSTEDKRFFSHSGVDFIGTLRAFLFLGSKGGGSTISQQIARQLFVGVRSRNTLDAIIQKVKEWVIAVQLERNYTKQEIIAMYFNIYDFGNLADGIRSASRIYFGKEPSTLLIEDAAILVGMFKNSSLYNPVRNPKGVTLRRNVVLDQMYKNDVISISERDSLSRLPLGIDFHPETHDRGVATYFRERVRMFIKKWILNNPKSDGTKYDLYRDGLKIFTTINKDMQEYAEFAVKEHMKNLQREFFSQIKNRLIVYDSFPPFVGINRTEYDKLVNNSIRRSERWRHMSNDLKKDEKEVLESFNKERKMKVFSWKGEVDTIMTPLDSLLYYKHFLRAGLVSVEPQTGYIKAWVGGINYKHFKYDQVTQGARQTGSTFKPFVYATAIDQLHLTPCDQFPDIIHCIEANKYGNPEPWCPHNSDNRFTGEMKTLRKALAKSINSISALLMDKVGPRPVVNLIHNLGITSNIPTVPSIALGTADVKLLEMVGAYSTFANKGIYVKPSFIRRIEDNQGNTIYEQPSVIKDVLSGKVASTVISLMKGVTNFGSGKRLKMINPVNNYIYKNVLTGFPYGFSNPIAGKTGTTQNHSDGWFIGMVPNLATGIWVGGDDRAIHFKSIAFGQGATMALPVWGTYMKKCYDNTALSISKSNFERPSYFYPDYDCDTKNSKMKKSNNQEEDAEREEVNPVPEKEESYDPLDF